MADDFTMLEVPHSGIIDKALMDSEHLTNVERVSIFLHNEMIETCATDRAEAVKHAKRLLSVDYVPEIIHAGALMVMARDKNNEEGVARAKQAVKLVNAMSKQRARQDGLGFSQGLLDQALVVLQVAKQHRAKRVAAGDWEASGDTSDEDMESDESSHTVREGLFRRGEAVKSLIAVQNLSASEFEPAWAKFGLAVIGTKPGDSARKARMEKLEASIRELEDVAMESMVDKLRKLTTSVLAEAIYAQRQPWFLYWRKINAQLPDKQKIEDRHDQRRYAEALTAKKVIHAQMHAPYIGRPT